MKAKVKETGEIIDVELVCHPDDSSNYAFYIKPPKNCSPDRYYSPMELDFGTCSHTPSCTQEINWEQRRYEIAKMVLMGAYTGPIALNVKQALKTADELIKQLKEGNI